MKVALKLKNEDLFYFAVYKKMEDAMTKHRDADVLVNFASLRSAYESTIETMNYPQVTAKIYHSFHQSLFYIMVMVDVLLFFLKPLGNKIEFY
jgi:hypothetical protein